MAWSQRDVPKTLYLKDGSFILGSLVGKSTTEHIWQLTDGTQLRFPNKVVKFVKDQKKDFQYVGRSKKGIIRKTKGYFGRFMVGYFAEKENQSSSPIYAPSINLTVGYQINPRISLGIGTGYDGYSTNGNFQTPPIIPLYLDLTGDIFNNAITPYYKLSAGYGFASPTKDQKLNSNISYKGGLLIHPSVGLKFYTRRNLAWFFDFGYRFQRYNRAFISNPNPERWTLQRTTFRIGIEF